MRIEHVAMYVNNLEKEKEFFETYFDAKAGDKYVHEEIDFSSYFLESRISPVSSPSFICMMVTPLSFSPSMTAH